MFYLRELKRHHQVYYFLFLKILDEDHWEYQEGAELAPSKADPSVTVPDKVLQVTMEELNYYNQQFPGKYNLVKFLR